MKKSIGFHVRSITAILATGLFCLSFQPAHAAIYSPPSSLLTSGELAIGPMVGANADLSMVAFQGNRVDEFNTPIWLIGYELAPPSGNSWEGPDRFGDSQTGFSPYTAGRIWLEAPQFYGTTPVGLGLNWSDLFRIHTDQIYAPQSYYGYLPDETYDFEISSIDALVAGSVSGRGGPSYYGLNTDLNFLNFYSCVECNYDVTLNLIGLTYMDIGGGFGMSGTTISDQGGLLLEYFDGYSYKSSTHNYYVQPVPAPAGLLLLSSCSTLLLAWRKRRG